MTIRTHNLSTRLDVLALEARDQPSGFGPSEVWGGPAVGGQGISFGDVNGDGRSDTTTLKSTGQISVKTSDGAKFGPSQTWGRIDGTPSSFVTADVTGDGRQDFVRFLPGRVAVGASTDRSFAAERDWGPQFRHDHLSTHVVDVTGDSRADLVVVSFRGVFVYTSSGSRFNAPTNWTNVPFYGNVLTTFRDVDADGRADGVVYNYHTVDVRRSNGSLFTGNEDFTRYAYWGTVSNHVADVTGDGRADALVVNPNGVVTRRSTGAHFAPNELWFPTAIRGAHSTWFVDVDGDRRADAVAVSESQIVVHRSQGGGDLRGWWAGPVEDVLRTNALRDHPDAGRRYKEQCLTFLYDPVRDTVTFNAVIGYRKKSWGSADDRHLEWSGTVRLSHPSADDIRTFGDARDPDPLGNQVWLSEQVESALLSFFRNHAVPIRQT